MKKLLSFVLVAFFLNGYVFGAGDKDLPDASKKIEYPVKPITLIVAGSPGGASDIGARMIQPYLEKELGKPISIVNNVGANGWGAWSDLANAKPDGYTLGIINMPALMTNYVDPKKNTKINLSSYTPVANLVSDYGVVAIRTDEKRFTNIKELFEYAKKNEVTGSTGGFGSDDHIAQLKINRALNTKFLPVHCKATAEAMASVMGGHVDVLFVNVSEVAQIRKDGILKVIAVMSEKQSQYIPEIPTLKESGYGSITNSSSRGMAGPAGLDPQILTKLNDALAKINQDAAYVKRMNEIGLQIEYMVGDVNKKFLVDTEAQIISMKSFFGW